MKHLKTFENYSPINEEEILNESKNSIEVSIKEKIPQWVKMGSIKQPTSSEIEKIRKEAESNNWLGELSIVGGKKVRVRDRHRRGKFRMVIQGGTLGYKPIDDNTKVSGFGHGNEAGYGS